MSVVVEAEPDVLEEDVFQEEAVSCFLSPLQTESIDFPDTPVSSHFIPITDNILHCSVDSLQFLLFAWWAIQSFSICFIFMMPN